MSDGALQLNWRQLNPNGFHLLKYMQDADFRFIVLYGGSSSGKSYSVAQITLVMSLSDAQNTLVLRKVGASIQKTIYEDFRNACRQLGMERFFIFRINSIRCTNGARIDFSGLDDPEKIKGIANYKRVLMEELSEFDEVDFKQIRKRLRGKKGQQIIATFNPIQETHWIKRGWLDKETWHEAPQIVELAEDDVPEELTAVKSIRINSVKHIYNPRSKKVEDHAPDTVVIQSTYLNNFWVVGSPDGEYGFYDSQCVADFENDKINDPDYYQVYALGEWGVIHTGSEFFSSFRVADHTAVVRFDPAWPVHISVDNNVLPYISCSFWQVSTDGGKTEIRQWEETAARSPNNTVRRSARIIADKLHRFNVSEVFLHGDASTRASNTIDEGKRSWLDLFIASLNARGISVTDCVGVKNPPVPLSGEFINAIFDGAVEGAKIIIGSRNSTCIEDYQAVQKDANGAILKTKVKDKMSGQSYEQHGHFSDTFRYLVCDVLQDDFIRFSNRRKRNLYAQAGAVNFYNPAAACEYGRHVYYFTPNLNGRFILVHGAEAGGKWHIVDVIFRQTESTGEVAGAITQGVEGDYVVECSPAYYPLVRQLREQTGRLIRIAKLHGDYDRRIAATSDYVRESVLFNGDKMADNAEYGDFMNNLLDYGANSESMEASAIMSGFAAFVIKPI